jgi:hypothetical protein
MSDSRDGGCLWRRGVFRQEMLELLKQIRMAMEQCRDLRRKISGEAELCNGMNKDMWRAGTVPPHKRLGWACYACGTC